MRRIYLIFLVLYFTINCASAQKINISGFVSNSSNSEQVIDAYVIELNSMVVAISNNYGFFSMSLNKSNKPYILIISNIAYKTDTLVVEVINDTSINIKLTPGKNLDEVVVSANKVDPIETRNEISTLSIPMRQIEILPAFGGERDIIKAYQLMPGVQSGDEGSSGLLVRGGSMDQNLILIDGTPIYYVNHLAGFVSVFNNEAINSTKLYKGGFPARYGGRLSSVLDIRMKEGNNKKLGGSASIGLLSAKVMLEGPIQKNKSSYLISYRRMLYDLFMRPISKAITKESSTGYYFHDLNLKINHTFSDKDKLFLSAYYGDDKMTSRFEDKTDNIRNETKYARKWGNLLSALRWNHLFNSKLFGNLTASFTRYRFDIDMKSQISGDNNNQENYNSFFSGIYDYSIQPDLEYYASSNYKVRFGGLLTHHTFKPGITEYYSKLNGSEIINNVVSDNPIFALESAIYIENELKIDNLLFNIGLRYSNYSLTDKTFHFFEPRILAKYVFLKKHSVEISYSKMHQNIHLLLNSGIGMPIDFWLPATGEAPPPISNQFAIGYASTVSDYFEVSIEGFYKEMYNLTTFKEGESYFGTNKTWAEKIETGGNGTAYGIDFLIQKTIGSVTGWIGYTWMKNYRQFENINEGKKYPYKYDRTHDISLVLNYQFTESVDISLTWVYGTGQALTLPVAKYYLPVVFPGALEDKYLEEIYIYTSKNAFRAKAYHRMDIGINFKKTKIWGERIWNVSIYNLYNRQNPYSYYFSGYSNGNSGKVELNQQSLFPFIPSISYSVKF
ncbi:MAG: TonB-dependent receptor plug domain-containing protein [Bacteroidales bacterium]|nr:TonB-dependent receptor plug domain-containing protein [Bacteroidales bacterium]